MNIKRIISSIVLILAVIALFVFGNVYAIDIVFSIIGIIALREFFNVLGKKLKPVKVIAYFFSVLIAFLHVIPIQLYVGLLIIFIPLMILILFEVIIFSNMRINLQDIAFTLFGLCYIVGLIIFIPLTYGLTNGKILIWYIFLSAWGTDIFAYSIGRRLGKHKFTKISPNKSIEGCIGGIVGSIIFVVGYTFFINTYFNVNFSYLTMGIVAVILSIFGQLGDLSASSIKRYAEVKDFGKLIPGHGGILDRIDSIIFMAPLAYIILLNMSF